MGKPVNNDLDKMQTGPRYETVRIELTIESWLEIQKLYFPLLGIINLPCNLLEQWPKTCMR